MPTRYYPLDTAADVSPAISAEWEHVNTLRKRGATSPDATAIVGSLYEPDASDHLIDGDAHHRQIVTDAIGAQTISGTVKGQWQCREEQTTNDLFLTLKIYIVSNDGSIVRGTLLAITRDATEVAATYTNRSFSATLTNVTAQNNDRIVVEVGLGGTPISGAGIDGHNGGIRWGGSASSGDLPEDDTTSANTYRPWIEFSGTISGPALTQAISEALLTLADSLATKLGKVLLDAPTLTEALALKTKKTVTDAASLTDAVSTLLTRTVSVADAFAIIDAVSLKTGKVITEGWTLTETVQALLVQLPALQSYYIPRPLITLTIGAETKRYSTETLVVPAAAQYGEAQYGESEYGGN